MLQVHVRSLVGDLRSHVLRPKNPNRSSIVANSLNTFKNWSASKKKKSFKGIYFN